MCRNRRESLAPWVRETPDSLDLPMGYTVACVVLVNAVRALIIHRCRQYARWISLSLTSRYRSGERVGSAGGGLT